MNSIVLKILVVTVVLGYMAQLRADSLAVSFAGTGDVTGLDEALAMAGVDLNEDTNLSPQEVSELEAGIAGCWAVPLLDSASKIPLGRGIDCLQPLDDSNDSQGAGISLRALSLFVLDSGTIVTLGQTSVRPFRDGGIGDADGAVTHMTGSIPSDKSGVIGGTGAFSDVVGAARVSGAVYLGDFPAQITFDCLWQVEVEPSLPPGLAMLDQNGSLPPGQAKK